MAPKLKILLISCAVLISIFTDQLFAGVTVRQSEITIPTYQFSARESEPPLFENSSVGGMYPLPPFKHPFSEKSPEPVTYKTVQLENEYLRLTYLPAFGGRFYSLYDKVAGREMFYENDVIKPAGYNSRHSFPLFGIELTGPYDSHSLTLHGEPLWFHRVIEHPDGSAEIVLGTIDPIYRMKINFSARLYPGIGAMQLKTFIYNRRLSRKPYMCWISGAMTSTPGTRFIYPMTRTIGHTTSEVADWPVHEGIDYSFDHNNHHMLGVFGIDSYDNFQGAYLHDQNYGVFRWGDRRVVQGMKMWTFGYSKSAEYIQQRYTDKGGPYIEVQSGRHIWDGHYDWLDPHRWEGWSEWWKPVAGIDSVTTVTRDLALNLQVTPDPKGKNSGIFVALSSVRELKDAEIVISAKSGELARKMFNIAPGAPYVLRLKGIEADSAALCGMRVTVETERGENLLDYLRPDNNPGEFTPFTRNLDKPEKPVEQMNVSELYLAARFRLKQDKISSAMGIINRALELEPLNPAVNVLLGVQLYESAEYSKAAEHLDTAIDQDPYLDKAQYYRALCYLEAADTLAAERQLYYIGRSAHFYPNREYLLGRIAFLAGHQAQSAAHLKEAVTANGYDLEARFLLTLVNRLSGNSSEASRQTDEILALDPTNRPAAAERMFLEPGAERNNFLVSLTGGQGQEALEVAYTYSELGRFAEAAEILGAVENSGSDPYGKPAMYYYAKAYFHDRAGDRAQAAEYLRKATEHAGNYDRWPFRAESREVLSWTIRQDSTNSNARFLLGCLLYFEGDHDRAISLWEEVEKIAPDDFSLNRALGMAYYNKEHDISSAEEHLEKAIALNPAHKSTFQDLSEIYAREGQFEKQISLLERAMKDVSDKDNFIEGIFSANLLLGNFTKAESLVLSHKFKPRHRSYELRDRYRFLRFAIGSGMFEKGEYAKALEQFEMSIKPPVSLGVDDFQYQAAPRAYYYLGRTYEALGEQGKALEAYKKSTFGWEHLSGDRDSWNPNNFFMAMSMDRLGESETAESLVGKFESFAQSQLENNYAHNRAEGHYLLALIGIHRGQPDKSGELLQRALENEPSHIAARLDSNGYLVKPH